MTNVELINSFNKVMESQVNIFIGGSIVRDTCMNYQSPVRTFVIYHSDPRLIGIKENKARKRVKTWINSLDTAVNTALRDDRILIYKLILDSNAFYVIFASSDVEPTFKAYSIGENGISLVIMDSLDTCILLGASCLTHICTPFIANALYNSHIEPLKYEELTYYRNSLFSDMIITIPSLSTNALNEIRIYLGKRRALTVKQIYRLLYPLLNNTEYVWDDNGFKWLQKKK